ncbi:MAG: radical SAM protein, partial [Desulfatitalea sp.]
QGPVAAMETIPFSLTTHRGCFGECRFCAIAVHQGRRVVSRSQASIVREAEALTRHPDFKGIIADVGGPTANMYAMNCGRRSERICADKSCLFPSPCKRLSVDHDPQIRLLRALRAIPGVRHVFVASGLRYDLILADATSGRRYLEELLRHHTSGQLKIAPEHIDDPLLRLMGKPGRDRLEAFLELFEEIGRRMPRRQFLTYYFMAAHPGCTLEQMHALRAYAERRLRLVPEQVQIFTPSPSTYATLMYYTGIDPFTGRGLFVERQLSAKIAQKAALAEKPPPRKPKAGGKGRPRRYPRP